jgi:hypothetical protein
MTFFCKLFAQHLFRVNVNSPINAEQRSRHSAHKKGMTMQHFFQAKSHTIQQTKNGRYGTASMFSLIIAMLAALMLSSCSTTSVDSQWSNPDFIGRKITGKVLVIGVSRDDAVRRLYEDEMASQLAAHGVAATRSFEIITGSLALESTSALMKAAYDVGASTILSSVVVDRQFVEKIISQPMPMYGYDFGRWYGYYWPYAYSRVEVRSFERYTISTSLIDVATGKIVWSARTETESVDHVDREVKPFVTVITKALVTRGLL